MKKIYFVALCLIMLTGCTEKDEDSSPTGTISFVEADFEVTNPDDSEEFLMGAIRDITTDREGNLYALDSSYPEVKKFNPQGELVQRFGNGRGAGPGEFSNPISVAVDSSFNVYVADMGHHNITVFDQDNSITGQISLGKAPARMAVDRDQNIYLLPFRIHESGDIIVKYSPDGNGGYSRSKSFGKEPEEIDSVIRRRSGNVDAITVGSNNRLYLSLWYPYEVREYSLEGELLGNFTREVSFFEDPYLDSNDIVRFSSGSWNILVAEDGLMINQIYQINDGEWSMFYDLIHIQDRKMDGTVSAKESGIPMGGRILSMDGNNNLFIAINDPEPDIMKYRLIIE